MKQKKTDEKDEKEVDKRKVRKQRTMLKMRIYGMEGKE
jgi:hypothetical protein